MTDTVNVERAWVDRFIAWVEAFKGTAPEGTVDEMFSLYTDARRFVLAAAPKAEPVSDPYKLDVLPLGTPVEVDFKEAEVGRQTLYVAGVVYDNPGMLAPEYWLSETWPVKCRGDVSTDWKRNMFSAQLEAPKVEQEPNTLALLAYRHLTNYADAVAHPQRADIRKVRDDVYALLQDHPAPASDELLEALRLVTPELTAEFANIDGPWCRGQMNVDDVWSRLIDAQIEAIAKHKGPQS